MFTLIIPPGQSVDYVTLVLWSPTDIRPITLVFHYLARSMCSGTEYPDYDNHAILQRIGW